MTTYINVTLIAGKTNTHRISINTISENYKTISSHAVEEAVSYEELMEEKNSMDNDELYSLIEHFKGDKHEFWRYIRQF